MPKICITPRTTAFNIGGLRQVKKDVTECLREKSGGIDKFVPSQELLDALKNCQTKPNKPLSSEMIQLLLRK